MAINSSARFEFESQYLAEFRKHFGELPDSYFLFDLETTGSDKQNDLIWNIGSILVKDGDIVEEWDQILDWTQMPVSQVDPCWLTKKIATINTQLRLADKPQHLTLDWLRAGYNPLIALQQFVTRLADVTQRKIPIVNHGLIKFDIPMLSNQTHIWLGAPFLFKRTQVFDTAAIEKAIELRLSPPAPCSSGSKLLQYQKAVLDLKTSVRFALDTHCAKKYNLWSQTGLSPSVAHLALNDTKLCHCLLSTYRKLR